ncbi:murein DD-endopeptidase MepM/ murein hydrolase activator NlpD [Rubellimicrobium aerolatum]|nr:murein DD-endopeptidase MepM/ murein hydrolase activator NlpD [Rubellimicrobium aerolatum]
MERLFPERRLFIRSGDHTRFVRVTPAMQGMTWAATGAFLAWSATATAVLLLDSIGAGNVRSQAARDRMVYEDRLNAAADERDRRAAEAVAAQERFTAALDQVATLQGELLTSEERARELAIGLDAVQAALSRTIREREAARDEVAVLTTQKSAATGEVEAIAAMLDFASAALAETTADRDRLAGEAEQATRLAEELDLALRMAEDRNSEIFQQLEDALTISVEPLDEMFQTAGLDLETLRDTVRDGSDPAGALVPIQLSTMGAPKHADESLRANRILDRLDELNLYRVVVDRVPLAMPLRDAFRYTSGFGPRWGRRHEGVDMAGPIGTPVYATAEGEVTFAGWMSGYGRVVKVRHEFGYETLYPHLNAIRAEVGQRVSRGDRVGDLGNSGRSTGPHLHYEVRLNGEPVNPMPYIAAGQELL